MKERQLYPNMIVVGGTGRNSGKTSFVCSLLEKYSAGLSISGLKISAVYPGEETFHGHHKTFSGIDIQLFRETNSTSEKDTSRMLRAGAKEVWFLSASDDKIIEGLNRLMILIGKDSVIVCESNSLAKFVKPGLFLMINRNDQKPFKSRVTELAKFADFMIDFDDGPFAPMIDKIKFNEQGWFVSD